MRGRQVTAPMNLENIFGIIVNHSRRFRQLLQETRIRVLLRQKRSIIITYMLPIKIKMVQLKLGLY